MLTLGAESLDFRNISDAEPFLIKLTTDADIPRPLRAGRAFLSRDPQISKLPAGFLLYVLTRPVSDEIVAGRPTLILPPAFAYLGDADVIRVSPRRNGIRVLYRNSVAFNSILLTERCNNYCLMCSQPPKEADDSWHIAEVLHLLRLIEPTAREICFSGGEPTLLGRDLFRLIDAAESWLPGTALHILSNGRRFADLGYAVDYASLRHHDLMVGIPLYSDLSNVHDYVVQADGAYDETIRGILNLKRARARVELRVVIHQQTYARLPELAEFITRNLLFVDHVALMGLELTGFAKINMRELWIDPYDYRDELEAAALHLAQHTMNVSIYNHQLCVLKPSVWRFSRQSISDWKNEFIPECDSCSVRLRCGGFFSSGLARTSDHIRAVQDPSVNPAEALGARV
jgi:His-Xaa-Ser system radical SAM maturase HxsC